jgi:hypothetical protein
VPDDRHVVIGVLVDAVEPLSPFDLLEPDAEADLRELLDQHLPRPHRVRILGRDPKDGLEAVRIPGLGKQLLGACRIVGHRLRHVHEVGVERVDVGPEDAAQPEHRALHNLRLVNRVSDRASHADVGVWLLRVVERQDHVARGLALDQLEVRGPADNLHRLRPQPERHHVDVARLERGQRGVGVGDEPERDVLEPWQSLDVVVGMALEDDAVSPIPPLQRERPRPDGLRLQLVDRVARIDHRALTREIVEEHRVRPLEGDRHRVGVPDLNGGDVFVLLDVGVLGLGVPRSVEDELDVLGRELAPVVEAYPLLEEEGVVEVVGSRLPALGQPRNQVALGVDFHQGLLNVVEDHRRRRRGRRRREVEPRRLGRGLHAQG